jgi:hypothetical protein
MRAFDEIDDYFSANYGRMNAIIPPTQEQVEAFSKHTQRAPDEQIAKCCRE